MTPAPIDPRHILDVLMNEGVITRDQALDIFGPGGPDYPLPEFELRLLRSDLVTEQRLLAVKGVVTGLPIVSAYDMQARPILPRQVAAATGAIVLAADEPTVAFVEPSAENVELVAKALRTHDFEIKIVTVSQFRDMLAAAYATGDAAALPVVADLSAVFDECLKRRASDVHLSVGKPPMMRIDGVLRATPYQALNQRWLDTNFRALLAARFAELAETFTCDIAYEHQGTRFRLNFGRDQHGWTLAARMLASRIPTLDDLNLPEAIRAFTQLERGLVLVTGPTGSGKSTTLAALLDHVSRTQARHLITLEDPVEYVLTAGPDAVVNQRELGRSFVGFADALRQALRQDPDVILVGEMRDPETARTAVTAAETGHLVFSTLHTYDAQSTVARLVSMYPEGEQDHAREKLAYILKGVVSQTLVPRANTTGRVAAMEIMLSTPAISNNLRNPGGMAHLRSTIQTSRKEGMQSMEMALADLVIRGIASQEEAEFRARDKEEFRRYLTKMDW